MRVVSACTHQCRLFFTALQFYTRLPIPRWVGFDANWLRHATRYLPLVGIVVAAIAAAIYALAALLLPAPMAAILSTAAGMYATGAFHEDGFADMCDGFGGGMTRQQVLEIMKDSRIGAYGAIGIGCILALKCAALSTLPPGVAVASLFLAHPLSRLTATALVWRLTYARVQGKAQPMAQEMRASEFAIAAATAFAVALMLGAGGYLSWGEIGGATAVAAFAGFWLARKFIQRIGGYTGDCLGAVQQVSEVAIYVCVLAGLRHAAW